MFIEVNRKSHKRGNDGILQLQWRQPMSFRVKHANETPVTVSSLVLQAREKDNQKNWINLMPTNGEFNETIGDIRALLKKQAKKSKCIFRLGFVVDERNFFSEVFQVISRIDTGKRKEPSSPESSSPQRKRSRKSSFSLVHF